MLVDCDECAMQHTDACHDCVVTAILQIQPGPIDLEAPEIDALESMADLGLVPTLRLVPKSKAG